MSPQATARYASPREEENCTITQAEHLIDQIAFIGFGKPISYILNDAVPLDVGKSNMYMDVNTPVYIFGYLPAKPDVKFDFAPLVKVVADSNGDAFVLYEQMQTLVNPGMTQSQLLYPFIHQMNLDKQLSDMIHSVVLPHTTPTPVPTATTDKK